jgi:hypothetical protein
MSINNQTDHHQYTAHLHNHLNSMHSNHYTSLNHHHHHHNHHNQYLNKSINSNGTTTANNNNNNNSYQFLLDPSAGSNGGSSNLLGTYTYNGNTGHYTNTAMDPSSLFVDTKQAKASDHHSLSPIKSEPGINNNNNNSDKKSIKMENGGGNLSSFVYQSVPSSFNSTASSSNPSDTSSLSSSSPSNSSSPTISQTNAILVSQSNVSGSNNSSQNNSKTFANLSSSNGNSNNGLMSGNVHQPLLGNGTTATFLTSTLSAANGSQQPMMNDGGKMMSDASAMSLFDPNGQDPIIEYNPELAETIEYELGLKKQNGPRFVQISFQVNTSIINTILK